jgi:hypothetical protein
LLVQVGVVADATVTDNHRLLKVTQPVAAMGQLTVQDMVYKVVLLTTVAAVAAVHILYTFQAVAAVQVFVSLDMQFKNYASV